MLVEADRRPDPRCSILASGHLSRTDKKAIVGLYTQSNNRKGLTQVLTTLTTLALLWWFAAFAVGYSVWFAVAAVPVMSLFVLRVFALMHECGHGSLFRAPWLNRVFGFVLGVVSGMPQYVWSRHHSYHHAHNGNWQKYRGPYTTMSVNEYAAMTDAQQRMYRSKCSIALTPVVGFIYLIFNPRYTWLKGSIGLLTHILRNKIAHPNLSVATHAASFETPYWKTRKEYWHMFWNNAALLALSAAMCWACGAALFFSCYLISVSLAGGVGIMLFTVQHNFEHSYASDNEKWDHDSGALEGTSFLILPWFMNWFTVNIAYHHIHHLSSRIPNYCLVDCHNKYSHLFSSVRRLKLSQIPKSLKCILWDASAQRIISVAEYRMQISGRPQPLSQTA
jgi:omega-6 fatty acid desaturase (delta-12 desaturase)